MLVFSEEEPELSCWSPHNPLSVSFLAPGNPAALKGSPLFYLPGISPTHLGELLLLLLPHDLPTPCPGVTM